MLSTIIPIILLIVLGMYCKAKQVFTGNGAEALKNVSVKFLWPLVLFYAFFTAEYDYRTVFYAATVFILLTCTFFITRQFFRKRVHSHPLLLPYLTVGSEIGMLGYSLYILLFGSENVFRLALFDVGHALFIFPVYLGMLNAEQGEGDFKKSIIDMLKSPLIIMLAAGLVLGLTGVSTWIMGGPAADVINRVYDLSTSANIVLMLISMGYSLSFSRKQIVDCLGFIAARIAAMAVCTCIGLLFIYSTIGLDLYTACALILTFSLPPVYMLSVYIKDRNENEFSATMTSIYTIITIIVFMVMTIIVK